MKSITLVGLGLLLVACQSNGNKSDKIVRSGDVYIADGSKQCQNFSRNIKYSAQILTDANIAVTSATCGSLTGVMYPAVCGGQNGKVHVFQVDDIDAAVLLGFTSIADLPESRGVTKRDCS